MFRMDRRNGHGGPAPTTQAGVDETSWNYKRHDEPEPGDFPALDLQSESESVDLPSPISTARFYELINGRRVSPRPLNDDARGAVNGRDLADVPELLFRDKTNPPVMESSTPVGSPRPVLADAAGLQSQLGEKQSLIKDLREENAKLKAHLETKNGELATQRRELVSLREEHAQLIQNYAHDREQWAKVLKSHAFEVESLNAQKGKLEAQLETARVEALAGIQDRETLAAQLEIATKEGADWLNKYEAEKAKIGSEEPLTTQFGIKYRALEMKAVEGLSLVAAQNLIKNILHAFNVGLPGLRDYVQFLRDHVLVFFAKVHGVLHGGPAGPHSALDLNDQPRVRACMDVLLNDLHALHSNV